MKEEEKESIPITKELKTESVNLHDSFTNTIHIGNLILSSPVESIQALASLALGLLENKTIQKYLETYDKKKNIMRSVG